MLGVIRFVIFDLDQKIPRHDRQANMVDASIYSAQSRGSASLRWVSI